MLGLIAREQRIPIRAPHQLDDIPAGAGEQAFQLLHDGAIAAHRSVQTLQIAIDHEHQIVQAFARRQRQSGQRLGFIHLAIANKGPHLAALHTRLHRGGIDQAAMTEIAQKARLINGL